MFEKTRQILSGALRFLLSTADILMSSYHLLQFFLKEMTHTAMRVNISPVLLFYSNTNLSSPTALYHYSRLSAWIFFSSSTILVAPIIFEIERCQMEEVQKYQQKQVIKLFFCHL